MIDTETIAVVSSADNLYVQHLCAAFASVMVNLSKGWRASFYVIDGGIDVGNRSKLIRTVTGMGADVELIPADKESYGDLFIASDRHITLAAYYRLSIPELFKDKAYEKVIYLDCDLIAVDDLSKLWQTQLRQYPLAAVQDPGGGERLAKLGIPEGESYFNSGVMLINLARWRELSVTERTLRFLRENRHRLYYHDQDGLNAVLYGQWLQLHPRWNVQRAMFSRKIRAELPWSFGIEAREGCREPGIVHFTGTSKPWQFDNAHPYKREYYRYLRMTEWKEFRPAVGLRLALRRLAKLVLPASLHSVFAKMKFRSVANQDVRRGHSSHAEEEGIR
ncbi:glycosyltransferase family 8 protein [Cohnella soli]|uniref:Glycosyltransferase family 8 protein n=1 Tax=Cohnella soli TaxID=425005 RepID=A0ABW0HV31_9BACL